MLASHRYNLYEIQAGWITKAHIYLTDSVSSYRDSVLKLYRENSADIDLSDIGYIFANIRYKKFDSATAAINRLPSGRSDWADLLDNLVTVEQHSLGCEVLQQNIVLATFFEDYANDEGRDGQAVARAILQCGLGTSHAYPIKYYDGGSGRHASALNEVLEFNGISVYPNPTKGTIFISSPVNNIEEITISDLSGRVVSSWKSRSLALVEHDISHLAQGMYLLTISRPGEKRITMKIVRS